MISENLIEINSAEEAWQLMEKYPERKTNTLRMLIACIIKKQPQFAPLQIRVATNIPLLPHSYKQQPSVFSRNLKLLLPLDERNFRARLSDDLQTLILDISHDEIPTTFTSTVSHQLGQVQKGEWIKIPWHEVPQTYVSQPRLLKYRLSRRSKHPINVSLISTKEFLKICEIPN